MLRVLCGTTRNMFISAVRRVPVFGLLDRATLLQTLLSCNLSRSVLNISDFASVKVLSREIPKKMKIDTSEFRSIFTPELTLLEKLFANYGYELRIAGGAVRDLLMNKIPHDIDFATTATPEQMKSMFTTEEIRMLNTQGEKHGTITPRINDKANFEVTTLRIDVVTDGRRAEVEFTKDWKQDANRRDLTINSMFLGLDGTVYDYFSGYEDLLNRRVIFVGDANTRVQEDYLRILRYFRFYGRIAQDPNSHDSNTLKAIKENVNGLQNVSGERIWSELRKILEGNFAGPVMKTMLEQGITPYIGLPDKPDIDMLIEVYNKTKENKLRAISLLSALFDSENDVLKFNARCKVSAFERDLALFIVEHRGHKLAVKPVQPYQKLVLYSKRKTTDVQEYVRELLKYKGDEHLLKEFNEWQIPHFPVSGKLLKQKGLFSGKVLGSALAKLKEYWIEKDCVPDTEELMNHLPEVLSILGVEKKL